ncbi:MULTISPECIES: hypothetical protein [Halorussus]|uniref:DUF7344 domain-containing protein n=1 Tax=Halorussus TaxID=1070314 RepID=UPI000E217D8B|nr:MULTISPECIES: hypothetical protein [Halorussus]NHN61197.1 hypothetical protein [Halorussus sp. JP-T4]
MTGDSAGDDDRGGSLGMDDALSLLSDRYRRHALACLDGMPVPVTLEGLTDQVAGREFQQPPDRVSMMKRTQIATALHHTHLPKLQEMGVIVYDDDEGKVTDIAIGPPLTGFLDKIRRHEG